MRRIASWESRLVTFSLVAIHAFALEQDSSVSIGPAAILESGGREGIAISAQAARKVLVRRHDEEFSSGPSPPPTVESMEAEFSVTHNKCDAPEVMHVDDQNNSHIVGFCEEQMSQFDHNEVCTPLCERKQYRDDNDAVVRVEMIATSLALTCNNGTFYPESFACVEAADCLMSDVSTPGVTSEFKCQDGNTMPHMGYCMPNCPTNTTVQFSEDVDSNQNALLCFNGTLRPASFSCLGENVTSGQRDPASQAFHDQFNISDHP